MQCCKSKVVILFYLGLVTFDDFYHFRYVARYDGLTQLVDLDYYAISIQIQA